jgi:hypothetical protein
MLGLEANERATPVSVHCGRSAASATKTRSWIAESLFGDIGKRIPSAEEPGPELAAATQVADDEGKQALGGEPENPYEVSFCAAGTALVRLSVRAHCVSDSIRTAQLRLADTGALSACVTVVSRSFENWRWQLQRSSIDCTASFAFSGAKLIRWATDNLPVSDLANSVHGYRHGVIEA